MSLPPKKPRARGKRKSSTGRLQRILEKRGVEVPQVFVRLLPYVDYGQVYAPAKIRVRRGCYRYLVWRDGGKKREFYLGKVRERAPQASSPAVSPSSRPRPAP